VTTAKKDTTSTATVVSMTVSAVSIRAHRVDRVSTAADLTSPASTAGIRVDMTLIPPRHCAKIYSATIPRSATRTHDRISLAQSKLYPVTPIEGSSAASLDPQSTVQIAVKCWSGRWEKRVRLAGEAIDQQANPFVDGRVGPA
jgi:hypothetical protein